MKQNHGQVDPSGGEQARRPRSIPRASPHVEVLETRCLMSGLYGLGAASRTVPAAVLVRSRHAAVGDPPATTGSKGVAGETSRSSPATPGSAGLAVALDDPTHAAYLIVHATDAPHSTLASAQDLPNVPYFGVIGTLGSENPIDVYRLTIAAGTAGIEFELVAQPPAALTPVQFALYNAAGRVLGTWSTGGQTQGSAAPIELDLPAGSLGPTLYLGISASSLSGNAPGASSPTTNYQLWVARLTTQDLAPASSTGAGAPALPNSSPALIFGPLPGATSPAPGQQTQALAPFAPAAGPGSGAGPALAVGSLPTRAAGPLGGALASGDTTQPAARPLSVTVNLQGSDRSAEPSNAGPRLLGGLHAEPGQEEGPQALVAIRGPGGFPLLGAAAMGNWRRTPRGVATAAVAAGAEVDAIAADRLALSDLPPAVGGAPAVAVADDDATRLRTRGESQVALASGLSLATFLTLNVVLCDPVAGFDYLASRLDSEKKGRSDLSPARNPT